MYLAGCLQVADDECDLTGALFDVKVAEVRAEKDELAQYIATVPHFCENNGNHWLLDEFEVGVTQMAYWKRVSDPSEEDREVVYPGAVGLAGAEGEEPGVFFRFVEEFAELFSLVLGGFWVGSECFVRLADRELSDRCVGSIESFELDGFAVGRGLG
jgi:hypothetical protein